MSFQEHYNQKSYKKISRFRKESILSFIDKKQAMILDIGCSDGDMGFFIKQSKQASVFGLDISEKAIMEAQKKLDGAFVFDISNKLLNFPNGLSNKKFDYIIISEVLEHLLYPENILENIKILMHENSKVIVTVPNVLFWKNRLKIFFGKFDYQDEGLMDRGHIHFFTWDSLNKIIEEMGYDFVGIKNNTPTRFTNIFGKFFPGLFAYQFAICIKKR